MLGLPSSVAFADDVEAVIAQAQQLLDAGDGHGAYEILRTRHNSDENDVRLWFLISLAALNSGRIDEAITMLETAVTARPDDAAARALLGRALFLNGDLTAAEREFTRVLDLKLPTPARRTVEQYLKQIRAEPTHRATRWRATAGLTSGYESNANRATDEASVAVPVFNNVLFELQSTAQETSSALIGLNAGGAVEHQLNAQWSIHASGLLRSLDYTADAARRFDQDTYQVGGGTSYAFGRHRVRAELNARWFTVDNDLFQRIAGGTLSWQTRWNAKTQFNAFFRAADVGYYPSSTQSLRSVTRWTSGVGAMRVLGAKKNITIAGGFYGGVEDAQSSAAAHLGRELYGARLSPTWHVSTRLRIFANMLIEASHYDDTEPLFLKIRSDTHTIASGGVSWRMNGNWRLEPVVQYARNRSNIPTSDYDTIAAKLTLRYDFN